MSSKIFLTQLLEIVIHDKHKRSTHTSHNIGKTSFEKSVSSFLNKDLLEAMHTTLVDSLLSSDVHLHSPSDSIDGIRDNTGGGGDTVSNSELEDSELHTSHVQFIDNVGVSDIVESEVATTVDENTGNGNTEPVINTLDSVSFHGFDNDVAKSLEFSFSF